MSTKPDIELLEEQYNEAKQTGLQLEEEEKPGEAADKYREAANLLQASAEKTGGVTEKKKKLEGVEQLRTRAKALENGELQPGKNSQKTNQKNKGETEEDNSQEPVESSEFQTTVPDLSLSDYKGRPDIVQAVKQSVVKPWQNKDFYQEAGLSVVNGVILYGPPGTGKTYLSKCLAGEMGTTFYSPDTSDLTSKYVDEGAENLSALFDSALNNQPAIVFVDELDALAPDRGQDMTQSKRSMVNQLLQSLTRIQGSDVVFIGATNELGLVDGAVKGGHRVQDKIRVGVPDCEGRRQIMLKLLEDVNVCVEDWNWKQFEAWTKGWTASDLKVLSEKSRRRAVNRVLDEDGDPKDVELCFDDLKCVVDNEVK